MPRKVIITINPMQDDPSAGTPADTGHLRSRSKATVRHLGAEVLMYPEPFRSIAEGRVGNGAVKKK